MRALPLPFQHGVRAIRQAQVGKTPAQDAHHHGLDHGQCKQRRHRGIHRIATGSEHLHAGR